MATSAGGGVCAREGSGEAGGAEPGSGCSAPSASPWWLHPHFGSVRPRSAAPAQGRGDGGSVTPRGHAGNPQLGEASLCPAAGDRPLAAPRRCRGTADIAAPACAGRVGHERPVCAPARPRFPPAEAPVRFAPRLLPGLQPPLCLQRRRGGCGLSEQHRVQLQPLHGHLKFGSLPFSCL